MTRKEWARCESLLEAAIRLAKQANSDFLEAEAARNGGNAVEFEIANSLANRHLGEAEGTHQALAVLGFLHERMKELETLL